MDAGFNAFGPCLDFMLTIFLMGLDHDASPTGYASRIGFLISTLYSRRNIARFFCFACDYVGMSPFLALHRLWLILAMHGHISPMFDN
jgi:hypothetical protein